MGDLRVFGAARHWIALLFSLALVGGGSSALAQSSATPVLPGVLVNTGCNPGQTICWQPYSVTNPLPVSVSGSIPVTPAAPYAVTPLGYQQISAGTLAAATALTVPTGATIAVVQIDTANVRYRDDGVTPTASAGVQVYATQTVIFSGAAELAALKLILVSGSPVANVGYYK